MHIWQCITSFTTLVLLKLMEPIGCANTAANVTTLSFAANDLQCLTQMPMSELLRIQRNLHQMHAVSDYNDRMVEMRSITTAIARIKNQTTDYEQTDAVQPEARHTFETTAAQQQRQHQPSAASLSMPSHANNHFGYNQFGQRVGYSYPAPVSDWEDEEPPSKIQKILHFSITALTFLAFAGYLLCMIVQAIKAKGTTYFHPGLLPMITTKRIRRPVRFRRQTEPFGPAEPDPFSLYTALVSISKGYVQLDRIESKRFT